MKHSVDGRIVNTLDFVRYIATKLPANEAYGKLIRALLVCSENDESYATLSYYKEVFEKRASKLGLNLE